MHLAIIIITACLSLSQIAAIPSDEELTWGDPEEETDDEREKEWEYRAYHEEERRLDH